jgi:hypothetical protein
MPVGSGGMRTRIWWSKYLDGGRRGRLATCPHRCAVECVEEDEGTRLLPRFKIKTNRYVAWADLGCLSGPVRWAAVLGCGQVSISLIFFF